uniref:Cytochrome P450 n=1 Tax=Biomphalaria glabrata TaxID=6526 RepID=A0A2C9JZV5_BIOGL
MSQKFNVTADQHHLWEITRSYLKHGLFFLQGRSWRRMRHILSPSFTTGKLKHMSLTIDQAAQRLTSVLESLARKGELLPIKYISGQYTSEIIARTGFGLETHCLGQEDDEFTQMCKSLIKIHGPIRNLLTTFLLFFPRFHTFLSNITMMKRFLKNIIYFLTEVAKSESWDDLPKNMSEKELIGQSILILFAGFETTSTTLQFCLYLLAQHQDVQEKLLVEIQEVIQSETPTYEEVNKLKYMEQVLDETLRLFPPLPIITRKALETKTYGDVTVPQGAWVMVLLDQIMMDPKHFPQPEQFDPERFSEENVSKRDSLSFVPFGSGPRLCLGMRLAYLELKLALVHVLRKVKVELNDKTEPKRGEKPKISYHGIVVVDNPIQLALTLRG